MQPSVHVELATRLTPGSISLLHWTNARLEAICRFPPGRSTGYRERRGSGSVMSQSRLAEPPTWRRRLGAALAGLGVYLLMAVTAVWLPSGLSAVSVPLGLAAGTWSRAD
jgi:hypothetical protein